MNPNSGHISPPGQPTESPRYQVGTLVYTTGGLLTLFAVMSVGDFALSMKERGIPDLFQVLLRTCQVSDWLFAALATALPAAVTMICGPIIGVISDNYRSRLGRRIPFLIAATPVVVASTVGLAFASQIGVAMGEMLALGPDASRIGTLWTLGLFWTLFEVSTVVSNGLFAGLVNDVVPQAVIGRFFGIFRIFSLLAGIIFSLFVFKHAQEWSTVIFLAIAALYGVGFGALIWWIREGDYPPPPVLPAASGPLMAGLGRILPMQAISGYYLVVIVVFALAQLAAVPINAFSLKSAQAFGLSDADYGDARAISFTVSLVLAFPLGWLSDVFHPVRTGFVALVAYGIGTLAGALFIHDGPTFYLYFIAHSVLSGTYFTTTASLLMRLFPRERFSQLASISASLNTLLIIIASLSLGRLLDQLGHDYRLTFLFSGLISVVAAAGWMYLHHRFTGHGGVRGYQPPA